MKVGFIVDHPKRDLSGGIMGVYAMAKRRIDTHLIPLWDHAIDVPLLDLDALFVNFVRSVNSEFVRSYIEMGISVWVLDTEGGVLADDGPNTLAHLAAYVRDSGYARYLEGYFFWGSALHGAFVDKSTMLADSLHLTGSPRFDFAAPKWRGLLNYSRAGYVLLSANFPLANPLFGSSPEHEGRTLVVAGWKLEYVQKMLVGLRDVLKNFIGTVDTMAQRFPERHFLVRPNPFENADLYRKRSRQRPNVVVDGSGSVLNVTAHASCVLHVNCVISIEAILLGKSPVSMELLNTEHMSKRSLLPSRVNLRVDSQQQLIEVLGDIDGATSQFDFSNRHQALIRPWSHLNGGAAADRIVDVMAKGLVARKRRTQGPLLRESLAGSRSQPRFAQRLQALAAKVGGSRASSELRYRCSPVAVTRSSRWNLFEKSTRPLAPTTKIRISRCVTSATRLTKLPLATIHVKSRR